MYKEKKYAEALPLFKEALESGYKLTENIYLSGVCYLWLGDYDNAIQEFTNLLDKQAFQYKNIFLLIAIAYKKVNNPQMAIQMVSFCSIMNDLNFSLQKQFKNIRNTTMHISTEEN